MRHAIARILRQWADELAPLTPLYVRFADGALMGEVAMHLQEHGVALPFNVAPAPGRFEATSMCDEVNKMLAEREAELRNASKIGNVDVLSRPSRTAIQRKRLLRSVKP